MSTQKHLDDELARFTDDIIAKRATNSNEELQELEVIVQSLHRIIKPDVLPSEQFQNQLTNRLTGEWSMVQNQRTANRFLRQRPMQIITLAASVAVILLASVLLLNPDGTAGGNTATTLLGSPALVITLMLLAAVVGVAAFAVWHRNR